MKNNSENLLNSFTQEEKLKLKTQRNIVTIIFGTLVLIGIDALDIVTNVSSISLTVFTLTLLLIDLILLIFILITYKHKHNNLNSKD